MYFPNFNLSVFSLIFYPVKEPILFKKLLVLKEKVMNNEKNIDVIINPVFSALLQRRYVSASNNFKPMFIGVHIGLKLLSWREKKFKNLYLFPKLPRTLLIPRSI